MVHIATLAAYPLKGGGYRGVMLVRSTKERFVSDKLDTLETARLWARQKAYDTYNNIGYRLAPIYSKNEYRANVWVN